MNIEPDLVAPGRGNRPNRNRIRIAGPLILVIFEDITDDRLDGAKSTNLCSANTIVCNSTRSRSKYGAKTVLASQPNPFHNKRERSQL